MISWRKFCGGTVAPETSFTAKEPSVFPVLLTVHCVSDTLVFAGFTLVIAGFVMAGFVASGFKIVEPLSPPGTSVPCGAVISAMLTVTLAAGLVEVTNTGRVALDVGGILRSSVVSCENCRNEAFPPIG